MVGAMAALAWMVIEPFSISSLGILVSAKVCELLRVGAPRSCLHIDLLFKSFVKRASLDHVFAKNSKTLRVACSDLLIWQRALHCSFFQIVCD